jgi:GH24 family phage-related lysozyme (muramidase)
MNLPDAPQKPLSLIRKGAIPAVLLAALTSPLAYHELERWEGNILHVYKDRLAYNIPTYCAGRTDWKAKPGTRLTSDQCEAVNKITLLEYGFEVLGCVNWDYLTPRRLIGLTMFAINVGKAGACNSAAVRAINVGNIKAGCDLIAFKPNGDPNWSFAAGVFVPGLHYRRRGERILCFSTEPV